MVYETKLYIFFTNDKKNVKFFMNSILNKYEDKIDTVFFNLRRLNSIINELKYILNNDTHLNYPKISQAGLQMKKQSNLVIKLYREISKTKNFQKLSMFHEDLAELKKKAKQTGRDIKRLIKNDIDLRLFPTDHHINLMGYIQMVDTISDMLLSI